MKLFSLQFSKAGYVADSLGYVLWVVIVSGLLVRFGPRREWLDIALLMGGGLMIWTFLEYVLHRFVLHGFEPFRSMHAEHHDRPHALIGIPTLLSAALFAALVFAPAVAMMDFWKGTGLTLGVVTGYLAYGGIHHAAHHWRPSTHWLNRRKQLHAIHHRVRNCHYGVTTSLWDWVFRSNSVKQRAP
jgi:cyclopropane-fatty-acyl-phospholipid synthase